MSNHRVMISDEEYNYHMKKINSMKASKRKNYKATLRDKWGQKSKLRFINNELMNYDIHRQKYCAVRSQSQVALYPTDNHDAINSWVGALVMGGAKIEDVLNMAMTINHTGNADGKARTTKHTKNFTQHKA